MKSFIAAVLAAALLLGAGAGVSYAYLTAQDSAENIFGTSGAEISVREEFQPPAEVKPGSMIPKNPRIFSSSDTDCYVRMRVRFSDSGAEKLCEPLAIRPGWEKREDGYYYWSERLAPGAETAPLFAHVEIRTDAETQIPPFEILIYAEAVQCGALTPEEAWKTMEG